VTDDDRAVVARLHGAGDLRIGTEPVAARGPDEVLVRVTSVGLCGSDLHWYREGAIGDAGLAGPLVLGHEFSGVIVDGPRAGERVAGDPAIPCGMCEPCRTGGAHVCLDGRFAGFSPTDGALRSLMTWPGRLLHHLPDAVGDDEAALLEPLGVALHALGLGPVATGRRAGVYGCGPLGLLMIQVLRHAGASVIVATDRLPHRVAAALAVGATDGFIVGEGAGSDPTDARRAARATPVDVAFEVAGDDDALSDAIAAVQPRGRVVLVGIPDGDRTGFPAGAARRKELTLQLSRRMVADDLSHAIALAGSGAIDLAGLISHRYPIDSAAEAFAMLDSRRGLKVIVRPSVASPGGAGP
jgi:L-iditol 2-dehydrogenase